MVNKIVTIIVNVSYSSELIQNYAVPKVDTGIMITVDLILQKQKAWIYVISIQVNPLSFLETGKIENVFHFTR